MRPRLFQKFFAPQPSTAGVRTTRRRCGRSTRQLRPARITWGQERRTDEGTERCHGSRRQRTAATLGAAPPSSLARCCQARWGRPSCHYAQPARTHAHGPHGVERDAGSKPLSQGHLDTDRPPNPGRPRRQQGPECPLEGARWGPLRQDPARNKVTTWTRALGSAPREPASDGPSSRHAPSGSDAARRASTPARA